MTAAPASVVTDDEVERVARALCVEDGYDPDALEPGDDPYMELPGFPSPCIDGYNHKDEPCHFLWRRFEFKARAALAASDRDVLVAENERLRETIRKALAKINEHNIAVDGMDQHIADAYRTLRAALIPLGGESNP